MKLETLPGCREMNRKFIYIKCYTYSAHWWHGEVLDCPLTGTYLFSLETMPGVELFEEGSPFSALKRASCTARLFLGCPVVIILSPQLGVSTQRTRLITATFLRLR